MRLRSLVSSQLLSADVNELGTQQSKGKERILDFNDVAYPQGQMSDELDIPRPAKAVQLPDESSYLEEKIVDNGNNNNNNKPTLRSGRRGGEMLYFLCPLTRDIFADPVFCADGYTYERNAITQYLKRHHKSPLTGTVCHRDPQHAHRS